MTRPRRRLLVVACALVLAVNAVLVAVSLAPDEADADPDEALVTALAPTTTTTTTTAPLSIRLRQPAPVPSDAYADEPHIVLGQITIPKLGLDVPLNQGISLTSIDRGPSHWPGTALPGEPGNVVVAGHRVTRTRPFRHLDQLVPGDEIVFTVDGRRWVYHVTGHEVVTPDAMRIVEQQPEPTVTLFACHPPGSARYRYVVRATLVGEPHIPPELLAGPAPDGTGEAADDGPGMGPRREWPIRGWPRSP